MLKVPNEEKELGPLPSKCSHLDQKRARTSRGVIRAIKYSMMSYNKSLQKTLEGLSHPSGNGDGSESQGHPYRVPGLAGSELENIGGENILVKGMEWSILERHGEISGLK